MREIGTIQQVQVQRHPLKSYVGEVRVYSPNPLLVVERLQLTREGIIGVLANGETLIDVHHQAHPQTRFTGDNSISFGFTAHYRAIQARYGNHVGIGYAGENILIHTDTLIKPEQVGNRVGLRLADGRLIPLVGVRHAPPCAPFSCFVADHELAGAEQKAVLQFLDNGMRGYYAAFDEPLTDVFVQAGDVLVAL